MKNALPVQSRIFLGVAALAVLAMVAATADFSPTPTRAQRVAYGPLVALDAPVESVRASLGAAPGRPALHALAALRDAGDSPLDDALLASDRSPEEDLAVVFNLFTQYRKRFGSYPTGEDNATFVNALTGNNPARLPLLDRAHPAINPAGELCDRWGTPFIFHLLASDALEVRSAGLDHIAHTSDDFVLESEQASLVQR